MKRLFSAIIIAILSLSVTSCREQQHLNNKSITVTIEPIKGLLENIVGSDFEINTLLPAGATPENYSPTMQQIAKLEDSEFVFCIGTLPFENQLIKQTKQSGDKFVDLSSGVELVSGCNGNHNEQNDHHHHSTDPHIWVSMVNLSTMVNNIDKALSSKYPDSLKYSVNCQRLIAEIEAKKESYKQMLITAPKDILIYHPALGYLSKELGLNQIALENEGKSPTPSSLADVIEVVEKEGIGVMFYQKEYPLDIVKPIADILGVNLMEFNPLSADIINEIDRVINIISKGNEQ